MCGRVFKGTAVKNVLILNKSLMLRFCGILLNGFFLAPKSLYYILVPSCVCFNVNQWDFCYQPGERPKSEDL